MGQYYTNSLDRVDAELKKKRPHVTTKKILFHHENHTALLTAVAEAKLVQLRYELLSHPTYSSNSAVCDFFFFFSNMKK